METQSRNKKIITVVLFVLFLAAGYVVYPMVKEQLSTFIKSAQHFAQSPAETIENVNSEFFADPLINKNEEKGARLTRSGVIEFSNVERAKEGKVGLVENSRLNAAAEAKLEDMFDRQYFEHVNPDGNGPSYVVEQAGYKYIVVGENLAMGNFKDDKALVAAWMASPGHRANIMHDRFTEIGVAVREREYEGRKVWMAVQEFGLPASSCPIIDTQLKASIDADRVTVDGLSSELTRTRREIDSMPRQTDEQEEQYRAKVEEYNKLVARYNTMSAKLKSAIDEYNRQVRAFNTCING